MILVIAFGGDFIGTLKWNTEYFCYGESREYLCIFNTLNGNLLDIEITKKIIFCQNDDPVIKGLTCIKKQQLPFYLDFSVLSHAKIHYGCPVFTSH